MLFKTKEDLVKLIPVNPNINYEKVKPFFEKINNQHIVQVLGAEEYKKLDTAYHGNTLSDKQTALLPHCQKAIAYLGLFDALPLLLTEISSSGVHVLHSDTKKSAFSWQVDRQEDAIEELGYYHLEALLKFLWAHEEDYSDWKDSDNKKAYRSHFINSSAEVQPYVDIQNSARTFSSLKPTLNTVEILVVKPLLERWEAGKFNAMLDAIKDNTALANDDLIIYNLLKPALAHLALANALELGVVTFNAKGVIQKSTEGLDSTKMQRPALPAVVSQAVGDYRNIGMSFISDVEKKIDELLGLAEEEQTRSVNSKERGTFLL